MKMLDLELGFEGQVGKKNGHSSRQKVMEKKQEADRRNEVSCDYEKPVWKERARPGPEAQGTGASQLREPVFRAKRVSLTPCSAFLPLNHADPARLHCIPPRKEDVFFQGLTLDFCKYPGSCPDMTLHVAWMLTGDTVGLQVCGDGGLTHGTDHLSCAYTGVSTLESCKYLGRVDVIMMEMTPGNQVTVDGVPNYSVPEGFSEFSKEMAISQPVLVLIEEMIVCLTRVLTFKFFQDPGRVYASPNDGRDQDYLSRYSYCKETSMSSNTVVESVCQGSSSHRDVTVNQVLVACGSLLVTRYPVEVLATVKVSDDMGLNHIAHHLFFMYVDSCQDIMVSLLMVVNVGMADTERSDDMDLNSSTFYLTVVYPYHGEPHDDSGRAMIYIQVFRYPVKVFAGVQIMVNLMMIMNRTWLVSRTTHRIFTGIQSRNCGFATLVLTLDGCKDPGFLPEITVNLPLISKRDMAGAQVSDDVFLFYRSILGSCPEVMVNLVMMLKDMACIQVTDDVGLLHSTDDLIFGYLDELTEMAAASQRNVKRNFQSRGLAGPAEKQPWWLQLLGQEFGPSAERYSVATQLLIGGVTGWCTGFMFQKVEKLAPTAVGGGFILLQLANHTGYIKVDWQQMEEDMKKAKEQLKNCKSNQIPKEVKNKAEEVMSFVKKNVIVIGGFLGGFMLGMSS
ncbi:hypothetical protein CB1_001378002 [Camelus ferus]|nr:hypothetical protein CB1_001378002 [Camelus ferus]